MGEHVSKAQEAELFQAVQEAFASSTQTVFYIMAGAMAVAFFIALIWSPPGKMEEVILDEDDTAPSAPS